jgi:amino acid adenylation domain-containing protein
MSDLSARLSQLSPEKLAALMARMRETEAPAPAGIPRRADAGPAPLSHAQERLWFLERLEPGSAAYVMPALLRLDGDLDTEALRRALEDVVRRHEVLRSTFGEVDGRPVQRVEPHARFDLPLVDLSALPAPEREAEALRVGAEEARRPFDLSVAPLLRALVIRIHPTSHILALAMHHVASDGASIGVLADELGRLYDAHVRGVDAGLPELPIQYADFAAWQRGGGNDEKVQASVDYWTARLAGAEPGPLPTLRPHSGSAARRAAVHAFAIPEEVSDALRSYARSEGATPFLVLLAGFAALLLRYTGQDDVVVATPVSGRGKAELQGLIGFFVDTLPLRVSMDADAGFRRLLSVVRESASAAFAHQDAPLERVFAGTGREGGADLLAVMLSLQNATSQALSGSGATRLAGLDVREVPLELGAAKCDLHLRVDDSPRAMSAAWEYDADLFDPPFVAAMAEHFVRLLGAALRSPDVPIAALPMLSADEARREIEEFARGAEPVGTLATPIHRLVEAHADAAPDAVAVLAGGERVTYAELDARANRLAHHLAALGVGPDVVAGVCQAHTADLIVSHLAVLKAGGAYLPIDPAHPAERIGAMLEDARALAVLADAATADRIPSSAATLVRVDADGETIGARPSHRPSVAVDRANLAYVVFTSGSTGRPKGVGVQHRSLAGLVRWHLRAFGVTARDRGSQVAGVGFDAAVWEVWPYLAAGASVVIAPEDARLSPPALRGFLLESGVTVSFASTPVAEALLALDWPPEAPLRLLLTGGDALRTRPPASLPFRLINNYGPTEGTVVATSGAVEWSAADGLPAIGHAIDGAAAYVVDPRMRPVPRGVAGELYVGGVGVARGYLGRPALTAERFVPDPLSPEPGGRAYRTGDRVRRRADGALDFLGRNDDQVKVRGVRIEPGEVEAALTRDPAVREAVVGAPADRHGERRLVAWIVPADDALDVAALRARLRDVLPEHMVPASFVEMGALPLTPNGKVDRRALPPPASAAGEEAYVAPRSPTEELLAGIFAEVLGAPRVGAHDDFFSLGGHSLLVTRMTSRIARDLGAELPLRAVFEAPSVALLAERVDAARASASDAAEPLVPAARDGGVLSFAQERLWFIDQMEPGGSAYNIPAAVDVHGALDVDALRGALTDLVARHESLRTVFGATDDGPRQRILPPQPFALPVVDVPSDAEADAHAAEEASEPFDLARGPLFRGRLLRLSADRFVLLLTLHHVVADGWSANVLFRELGALYRARVAGGTAGLPPLPVQYADFAAWQRRHLSGERLARQTAWWRERLRGAPALLELPTDRPRPPAPTHAGGTYDFAIPMDVAEAIHELARAEGATPFMALLAAFQVLLARYSRQGEVVVGSPIAGRSRVETEGLIGFFVNTLALRADLSGGPTFRELLAQVRETTLGAYAHQDVPFEKLVEEMGVQRSLSYAPLFQVMFVLQNAPAAHMELPGVRLAQRPGATAGAKLDLTLAMREAEDGLRGTLEYAADLFDPSTAEHMAGHFAALLRSLASHPDRPVHAAGMLPEDEESLVLRRWNSADTRDHYRRDLTLHGLFEEQVRRTPRATALVCGGETLSYGELNRRANRLAHRLRAHGVGPEVRAGILMERTPDLVAAMLAVLKSGGAYVPLDPEYPAERVAFMLADTRVPVLLTQSRLLARLPALDATVLAVDEIADDASDAAADEDPGVSVDARNLAYVIYTSGSTGRPKGVQLEHGSAGVLVQWLRDELPDDLRASVLASTSVCFDVSIAEVFGTLCWGGKLVLVPNALSLASLPAGQEVAMACMVPSAAAELLRMNGIPAHIRTLNLGGEPLPAALARDLYATGTVRQVVNLYGPSEDTTYSTALWVGRDARRMTVGRALSGKRLYVLDGGLRPCGVGVPGELFIAGHGVARGYHDRPGATAEKYLPDPFGGEPGARMYRTGDLARWLESGEVEYLGRLDEQVKIRGHRVEVGEVAAALATHPALAESTVAARADGGVARLVAYYVAREPAPTVAELRAHVRERLPDYMVPSAWVPMAELPHTPSGKLDKRSLPAPDAPVGGREHVAPRTPAERLVAGVWADVLGVERVGVHDDFFELGGHSLLATRVATRIRQAAATDLPVRAIFECPTVEALAARVAASVDQPSTDAALPPLVREPDAADAPLSTAQERMWLFDRLEPGSPVFNLPSALRLRGALDVPALEASLREIVRRHESLRTVFRVVAGHPHQLVLAPDGFSLHVEPVDVPMDERDAAVDRWAAEGGMLPFDLAAGPLFEASLLRFEADDHALLLRAHHSVIDGWGLTVLFRELEALYAAIRAGQPSPLPEPALQYADYARWQRSALAGPALVQTVDYWRRQLSGAPAFLELPSDRPRPAVQSHRGETIPVSIESELAEGLRALARREGATPFMALLAAFTALAYRYTGQADVVVGTPTANRDDVALEGVIGCFINLLPLRTRVDGRAGFRELLRQVRGATLEAHRHQQLPFERMVEAADVAREPGRPPLVQVLFVLHNAGATGALDGVRVAPLDLATGTAKYDLSFYWSDAADGGMTGHLEYATDLYDAATARGWMRHLARVVAAVVADPDASVDSLPVLDLAERTRLLAAGEGPRAPFPAEPVHASIEAQVRRTPHAVAAAFRGQACTYAELNARANRLAHRLASLGVGEETRVGLLLDRGVDLLVSVLAVMKAGGAYVPLDASFPAARLAWIAEDAGVSLVLTERSLADRVPETSARVLVLEDEAEAIERERAENPPTASGCEAAIYTLYTSGSTGHPKGVVVTHRSVQNFVAAMRDRLGMGPADSVLAITRLGFDISVLELMLPLTVGARVEIADGDTAGDARRLAEHISAGGLTFAQATPATWQMLLETGWTPPAGLTLISGGEALPGSLAVRLTAHGHTLWNLYGPTEATVWSAAVRVGQVPPEPEAVELGEAILNTGLYVLDERLEPVLPGAAGELYIGGAGLARGYRNRPALTAERFVPSPHATTPGERLYRTGDLAARKTDGRLVYLGRTDEQVKVRGFRIELGEIEAVLEGHAAIRRAVVVARGRGAEERILVAFALPSAPIGVDAAESADVSPDTADAREILAYAAEHLPGYMVPSHLELLAAFPMNANGKVDRRALSERDIHLSSADAYVAPRTEMERIVAAVFGEVLGRERVGAHDDFFALGGHSLRATQAVVRLNERLGAEIPLREVVLNPTVSALAARLGEIVGSPSAESVDAVPIERVPEGTAVPLSFAQQRLWLVQQMDSESRVYNLPIAVRVRGALSAEALRRALDEVVRRHGALRTRFEERDGGPVQIVAAPYSLGLPLTDVSADEDPFAAALRIVDSESRELFDLASGRLLRGSLIRLGEDDHVLALTVHHVATDGWSAGVLLRETGALYHAFAAGAESPLPEPGVQYADYALWQRRWMTPGREAAQLDFWRARLAGAADPVLPGDLAANTDGGVEGATERFTLHAELSAAVKALSRSLGATDFMTLLAAFSVLLNAQGGGEDVVVGTDVANRNALKEAEGLIGFFVNQLVLRVGLGGDPTFADLVGRARDVTLGAFEHQDVPFERVVEALNPRRRQGGTPFFNAKLVLQNAPVDAALLPGLTLEPVGVERGAAQLDLILTLHEAPGGFQGHFEYRTRRFSREWIARRVAQLGGILQAVTANPRMRLSALATLLDEGERQEQRSARQSLQELRRGRFGARATT